MSLVTTHDPITFGCINRLGVDFPLLEREEDVLDRGLDHAAGQAAGVSRGAFVALRYRCGEVFLRQLDRLGGLFLRFLFAASIGRRALRTSISEDDGPTADACRSAGRQIRYLPTVRKILEPFSN